VKILLVEDDFDKREKIKSEVKNFFSESAEVVEKESLRSAWRAIVLSKYDLLILDMSLPSSDAATEFAGEEPESFAGREIMDQMRLRGISIPVIVVTQYQTFENGRVGLDELILEFKSKYHDFFKGCIYYNSSSELWRREIISKFSEVSVEIYNKEKNESSNS